MTDPIPTANTQRAAMPDRLIRAKNAFDELVKWYGLDAADIERLRAPPAGNGMREALEAAVRAMKLALFVINKQGVMPNSSWETGFNSDLAKVEAAYALASQPQERGEDDKDARYWGSGSISAAPAARPSEATALTREPVADLTNHHNALKCPYCNPQGLSFASPSPVSDASREALELASEYIIEFCDPLHSAALLTYIRNTLSPSDKTGDAK